MKKKILIAVAAVFLCGAVFFSLADWGIYLRHLAMHQMKSVFTRQNIADILISNSKDREVLNKLRLITEIQKFGGGYYHLKDSESFRTFVQLSRRELGWNITFAESLRMKAVEFHFPLIGSFGYLGFFDSDLLKYFQSRYPDYDSHVSEIAAYSTLGWFRDPVYSTYLQFSDIHLARLVLHEMAHEKLYFSDDTDLSERLASFVEKKAADSWMKNRGLTPPAAENRDKGRQRALKKMEELREQLIRLYSSPRPVSDMLREKRRLISAFTASLRENNGPTEAWMKKQNWNNAVLIQMGRYDSSDDGEADFERIWKSCRSEVTCWFDRLKALKPFRPAERLQMLRKWK